MSCSLYTDLAWLPRPPQGLSALCRAALENPPDLVDRLRFLASHALDENGLARVAKVVAAAQARGSSLAPLTGLSLGVVSNATSHFLLPALVASAVRHGLALTCIESDFDQMMQEALAPDSAINTAQLDAVLVALDHRGLPLRATPGNAEAAARTVAACLAHIDTIRAGLRANGKTICLLQTLPPPPERLFGSLDAVLTGSLAHLVDEINRGIADRVANSSDLLVDVAGLAATVGLADWHDPTLWNLAKMPFSGTLLPLYADHVARVLGALRGKSRRCLILDLDNTLWGGVIGDDGLEGIAIGQGDATGEAHLSVQRLALALRQRGVVLAVSSKNNDDVARLPFRQHPEMLLKEDHIAVFQANWNDKATNIKAIAEELSLGIDAMVFLDDNPVERGLVRQMLPQVAVPELPQDPALYARTLAAAGYFEAVAFSAEDGARADFYQDNARRIALQGQAGDIESYLRSLDMTITFQPFDDTGRSRIAQLIAKSNQFNLTTRRYSEAEVLQVQNDPDCFALQIRLADAFGDNGMISVVICRRDGASWNIDTWLMSCRVLGRHVEIAVLQELARHARARGIGRLVGVYRPTERNALVEHHYEKLGFTLQGAGADRDVVWTLDLHDLADAAVPMQVRRIDLESAA
jgi:FkbH-like protein